MGPLIGGLARLFTSHCFTLPWMCERDGMPIKRVTCPDCGLVVTMSTGRDLNVTTMTYDHGDWRKRCKRIDFESPVWCLIARDGTSPRRKTKSRARRA